MSDKIEEKSELIERFRLYKRLFQSRLKEGERDFAIKKLYELIGFCHALAALYDDGVFKDKALLDKFEKEVQTLMAVLKG